MVVLSYQIIYRYYSPREGLYTKPDPIGLDGGNPTLYGYVSDPNSQIDP
ncbi:RHS repeat-associated core domain-containing protein [Cohnella mopanensis]